MNGKMHEEILCSHGACIHTQMCSLCWDRAEPGQHTLSGAGNWFSHTAGSQSTTMGELVTADVGDEIGVGK